jgi:hypothetical protein
MNLARTVAVVWGIGGVLALLTQAIIKLTPIALEPLGAEMAWGAVAAYVASVVLMAYSEGWRGFHQKFSPRVVARAAWLAENPRPLWLVLAPAFCTGLIGASRKRKIVAWILPMAIVVLVLIVRNIPQPWRGAVDAGVVVGLSIGCASIFYHGVNTLRGKRPDTPLDLPPALSGPPASDA